MRMTAAGSCLALLLAASPALAHHIAGFVYCDQDADGVIDTPGDTPIVGLVAVATSLDVAPGSQFTDGTGSFGEYNIALPQRTDRYRVELTGLPAGVTVIVPAGGAYVIQIVTGTAQDHVDDLDFLAQGCGRTTTSTTTTTTSTSPPSTTVTTTTSTTTTTLFFCNCPATPFLSAREVKVNNDGTIGASVGANDPGGRVRLGKGVTMPDGTTITGDAVYIGNGSNVSSVLGNTALIHPDVVVRNGTGPAVLPIVDPFCALPAIACGSQDLQVSPGETLGPLAPGTYGRLRVLNGASVVLSAGEFTFCEVRTGRNAVITTLGPATLDVAGDVSIGTASRLGPESGTEPVRVNVGGRSVRVSQSGAANAAFIAPGARISFGRNAFLLGCFCTDRTKSDKHITLACPTP
jgi:hypothetical protein